MKKQKIRFYAALLCSSMVLSLVSTPVSAAETGQLTNPPTSTEGPGSPESASGNEAAAVLNGLYAALPVANGVKEVATADELTDALADSSISIITLKDDVEISSTLTVNRTVTLDLNGIWGTIAVGLFDYKDGLFYGGGVHHLLIQLLGILCIAGWTIITMGIVFTVLKKTIGLRVTAQEEIEGLDSTEHGLESGYPDFVSRELH